MMIDVYSVIVDRANRQREKIDVSDLIDSIRARGVITPIIVEERDGQYHLIAGERRLIASKELGLKEMPVRLLGTLSPVERQIIELEENIKRKDLDWKDQVKSVLRIHRLYELSSASWTQTQTASALCMDQATISQILRVAEETHEKPDHPLLKLTGYRPAYNQVTRKQQRAVDDALSDLLQVDEPKPVIEMPDSILNDDFLSWAPTYSGRLFTFVHCDFPYGINLQDSEQAKSADWGAYQDDEPVYWELIKCLCDNINRLMAPSSHLLFWLSSDISIQFETLARFEEWAPSLRFQFKPLIWFKSDNRGILADPKRGPRHVYESCLLASRGDRPIISAVSDCYAAPTGEKVHQSEKVEPMLRHFFRMLVDQDSRVLDPTCGAGSAIRAADSLGAEFVLGIERDPGTAELARTRLRQHRALRSIV